ncbi:4Fe-4S cluster-binding domain-containing protein, partial [bacterium]|nr:4Fe-4S cluster-binding domain-containing protein [bacterium]
MEIKGFQGISLIDYPGRISTVIFVGGCNFRCPFCHNKDLVLSPEKVDTL